MRGMSTTNSVQSTPSEGNSLLFDALVGALVSVVLFFLPLVGTVVGGATAGYLHRTDGLKVGALSGLLSAVPFVALAVFAASVFVAVPAGTSTVGPAVMFVLMFVVLLLVVGAINAAFGALGGYLGVYLRTER